MPRGSPERGGRFPLAGICAKIYKQILLKEFLVMLSRNFIENLKTVNLKGKAPDYNFMDVIGKTDNENIISEWLAFLFDANKSSSLTPLKLFCNFLDIRFGNGEVTIEREYTLDDRRRIDIIIKSETAWIIIENKINSMECNGQTVDYEDKIASEICGQNISLYFVYLKPTYNMSSPINKKFKVMTYKELAEIWKNINTDDFIRKENYVYFSEFMKLINERYAMSKELQFDENTKLYIEFSEQFNAVENSFNNACQTVKDKLINMLNSIFPIEESWIISFHPEYIQFYKASWGSDLHFEIGTWAWQRSFKNISFSRLLANKVEITYCLHAERKQAELYAEKFKHIETENSKLFRTENYNFDNEKNCISSLNAIAERLLKIKNSVTPIVENAIKAV